MFKKFLSAILVLAMTLSITAVPVEVSACSGKKHTVKFYAGKTLLKSQSVTCGKAATAPKSPSQSGFTFTGWDKPFNNVTKNLTVNAVFKENVKSYTVKFYNGSKLLKEQTVKSGNAATAPKSPSKTGFTFTGWDKAFNKVTKNISVYAVFKQNTKHTVIFNSNGGSKVSSQTVNSGSTIKKPTDPTREGYIFDGWYSDSSHKALYNFSTKVTKDFTLYAKWKKDNNNGNNPANGIYMTIQDIHPRCLSYFFTNTTDNEYTYTATYDFYEFRDNAWRSLGWGLEVDDWIETILPHSTSKVQTVYWPSMCVLLPNDKYKFKKYVTFEREPGVWENIYLEKEFVLP